MKNSLIVLLLVAFIFTNCTTESEQINEEQLTEENAKLSNSTLNQEDLELNKEQKDFFYSHLERNSNPSNSNGSTPNDLGSSGIDYMEIHFGEVGGGTNFNSAHYISQTYPGIVVYKNFKCYYLSFNTLVDLGAGAFYAKYRTALSGPSSDIAESSGSYILLDAQDSTCSCNPHHGSTNTKFVFYPDPGGFFAGLSADGRDIIISTTITSSLQTTWCD